MGCLLRSSTQERKRNSLTLKKSQEVVPSAGQSGNCSHSHLRTGSCGFDYTILFLSTMWRCCSVILSASLGWERQGDSRKVEWGCKGTRKEEVKEESQLYLPNRIPLAPPIRPIAIRNYPLAQVTNFGSFNPVVPKPGRPAQLPGALF